MSDKKMLDMNMPMSDFVIAINKRFGETRVTKEILALLNKCELLMQATKHAGDELKKAKAENKKLRAILDEAYTKEALQNSKIHNLKQAVKTVSTLC